MTPAAQPGIWTMQSRAQYDALAALNHSGLRAWVKGDEPKYASRALLIGTAVHAIMLPPEGSDPASMIKALDHDPDLRTREGKLAMSDAEAQVGPGGIVLKKSEAERVAACVRALRDDEVASRILGARGEREVALVADLNGVRCKGLLDLLGEQVIVDLKTTSMEDSAQFRDSIVKFGYDSQGAFYSDLHYELTGEYLPFVWVCVSTKTFDVWTLRMSGEQYASGRRWYRDCLGLMHRSKKGELAA